MLLPELKEHLLRPVGAAVIRRQRNFFFASERKLCLEQEGARRDAFLY